MRVLSFSKEVKAPRNETALFTVLHLASQKVDVKIAQFVVLTGGEQLVPLAGGEEYYRRHKPPDLGSGKSSFDENTSQSQGDPINEFRRLNEVAAKVARELSSAVPAATPSTQ